jgi:hypothetical protein
MMGGAAREENAIYTIIEIPSGGEMHDLTLNDALALLGAAVGTGGVGQ